MLASLLLSAALAGYRFRDRLSAMEWHLLHGNSVRVDNYEVPVPSDWLVFDELGGDKSIRPIDRSTGIALITFYQRRGPFNVDAWAKLQKVVLEKQGVQSQEIRLTTREEPVECIGGDYFKAYSQVVDLRRLGSLVMECESPSELWIDFLGEPSGLKKFSEIVSSIHRLP